MEPSSAVICVSKAQVPEVGCYLVNQEDLVYPLQGDSRAVFALSDSKSEEWEKIGNMSLESCSQIFEEIRRIQDPVQFTDKQQNLKDN